MLRLPHFRPHRPGLGGRPRAHLNAHDLLANDDRPVSLYLTRRAAAAAAAAACDGCVPVAVDLHPRGVGQQAVRFGAVRQRPW